MNEKIRPDYRIILDTIEDASTVLDLGCGQGELLKLLMERKKVKGQGVEIDHKSIYECLANGISAIQGDIDSGLKDYSENGFDYVILNQSWQQVREPARVLDESLRVGNKVIIGFPNFAYVRSRFQMFFAGQAPVTRSLPYEWYDTPNSHFFSILDFQKYCRSRGITIECSWFLSPGGRIRLFPNVFAQDGLFLIRE